MRARTTRATDVASGDAEFCRGVEDVQLGLRDSQLELVTRAQVLRGGDEGEQRRVVADEVDELLVAEVLGNLDRRRECEPSPGPFAVSTCSGRKPTMRPSSPAPTSGAGTRFIAGEPMNPATNTFAGRS